MAMELRERLAIGLYPRYERFRVFQRFIKLVRIGRPDECWEWQGATCGKGYGAFKWSRKGIHNAHVAAYELFVGSRRGLHVLHSCDNPICVNPNHLWLGTNKQNIDDMIAKGRRVWRRMFGEQNANSKLTYKAAAQMRKLYASGQYTQRDLTEKFGVGSNAVYEVVTGKRWTQSTKGVQ